MSTRQYSFMSDIEFVRFAEKMVGVSLYEEAVERLEKCVSKIATLEYDLNQLEQDYKAKISRLNAQIAELEDEYEYA